MPLGPPTLHWQDGATPVSARFDDVYFDATDGLAETRHVFLQGCGLPERFGGGEDFVIGETGFGTGLNFLAAWQAFRWEGEGRLHYFSVEAYPLSREEMARALTAFPELADLAAELLAVYPEPQAGFHRLVLDGGLVTLTLMIGEAVEVLGQMEAKADAWFLDGFAPAKNPEMWRPEVLAEVARLSAPGARLATFTAAGFVRRGLGEVGYAVERVAGFGRKREMLVGTYEGPAAKNRLEPWFRLNPPAKPASVAVIGGGVAGCAVAGALMRRGLAVTIVEEREGLAQGASGNPVGVAMPRLPAEDNRIGRFFAEAFRFAMQGADLEGRGVLQLATSLEEEERQHKVAAVGLLPESMMRWVEATEASDLAGVPLPHGGLWYPSGGWLRPPAYCRAMAEGAEVRAGTAVASLVRLGDLWRLLDKEGRLIMEAEAVVLANALAVTTFPQTAWLPVKGWRGQITQPVAEAPLKCVVTYGGYVTPAVEGRHCLGATYDPPGEDDESLRSSDHGLNYRSLEETLPGLLTAAKDPPGRAGVRCMCPDDLPLVGPAPDYGAFLEDYAPIRHGVRRGPWPDARFHPGLFMLAALGSRGMVTAPLCAEILAAQMCGGPWPVERELATILHPARHILRALRKGKA